MSHFDSLPDQLEQVRILNPSGFAVTYNYATGACRSMRMLIPLIRVCLSALDQIVKYSLVASSRCSLLTTSPSTRLMYKLSLLVSIRGVKRHTGETHQTKLMVQFPGY